MERQHGASQLPSRNASTALLPQHEATPLLPTDIVILVMGIVGAGRSTFVNALLPKGSNQRMAVGGSLSQCTMTADCVILDSSDLFHILGCHKAYRLVLVDTPGFDAESKSDSEGVLQEIAKWSKRRLPNGQKCRGGVIFMHDISCDTFPGRGDLAILGSVFNSPSAPSQLTIVTSKWRYLPTAEAEQRHHILVGRFGSAQLRACRDEKTDPRKIVNAFLPQIERGAMLDFGRTFEDMKNEKRERETRHKREKDSFLRSFGKSILRLFGIGKKRRKGKGV